MIMQLLDAAIKLGKKEWDFWEMTLGEVQREIDGIAWRKEQERKEKATFDYALAQTISAGVAVLFGSHKFPTLHEIYPSLFEEDTQAAIDKSIIRFKQFVELNNMKYKRGE